MAIAATGAVAVGVAGATGAFSTANRGAGPTGATTDSVAAARMPMPMPMSTPMSTATTNSAGPLRLALHQRLVHVKIMNFAFMPARIEVSPGTRVVWTNQDSDPHTVTTDKPAFSSQALDTGQSYARVLTTTGTFTYHCTIHPFMHGTVVVAGRPA
ncbi:MAG TPA: plastocyanin/azurin family copper-binding protein [Solirubrobacteraceae bacterium]|nr:plastocyanin/azurin family copper-binding protein [Solirubrobacteraceae bacterium]